MPTAPRSGFMMRNVRATAALNQEIPKLPSLTAAHDAEIAEARGEVGMKAYESYTHQGHWRRPA
jgi:hypothetical protein